MVVTAKLIETEKDLNGLIQAIKLNKRLEAVPVKV